jgi:electron-transferring-flavoprotein dehydrogenase
MSQTSASDTTLSREIMQCDVLIVGAGPAGLAAAIRLRQLQPERSVIVIEKGLEIGAHTLSGAVIDPAGLDALLPDWREDDNRPLKTKVTEDHFLYLGPAGSVRLPHILMPPLLDNRNAFIGSLGDVVRYLGNQAEALGVEIYPGFAAAHLIEEGGVIRGVLTGDMGLDRSGKPRADYTPGMELRARYTLLAEGARGHLARQAIIRFALDEAASFPKYGLGIKELWRIRPENHKPGFVQHTIGWPLDNKTGGGSFLYHYGDNLVSVGYVVHLDYENPTLSPFDEFQRFKTHPLIKDCLDGGERLSWGARVISEGGWQSVPRLAFPGGALLGCAAGFVNVPRIKGSHNAILSGKLCAETLADALKEENKPHDLDAYETAWRSSAIGRDLYPVRNVKPLWSRFGTGLGVLLGSLDMWCQTIFRFSPFGTLRHKQTDHQSLKPRANMRPKLYSAPDNRLTFDRLSSVYLSGTQHAEDQPPHLKLKDASIPVAYNLPVYGEPARFYCPAGVYEVIYGNESARTDPHFVINAQNCIHCKTCDIKDPGLNILWTPPEGGGGPAWCGM